MTNIYMRPCPFCGGKPKIMGREMLYHGKNLYGTAKLTWQIYVRCNKCYSRGKPVKTEPMPLNDDINRRYDVGNFYSTKFWRMSEANSVADSNFMPYVLRAVDAWNNRC